MEQPAGVLFALHNDLVQHQKSVHQAFAALDQACCALAASVATQATVSSHEAKMQCGSNADSPKPQAATSSLRGFAALLRGVEVLHHFLFTNLYVHQRESALQLVSGVERAVLNASAAGARDDSGWEELRTQTAQLRHHLLHAPQTLLEERGPRVSASGTQPDYVFPRGSSTGAADVVAVRDTTTAPPLRGLIPKSQRLFALSAAFAAAGEEGQARLHSVLQTVQRRFRIHAVVLARAAPPAGGGNLSVEAAAAAEVQLALQHRCLCLVVPHHARRFYPDPPPIFTVTDNDILPPMAAQQHSEIESDSEEEEEGVVVHAGSADMSGRAAALEALFDTLEADLSDYTSEAPPWSPTSGVSEETEVTAVQRAALKRGGRPTLHREKRPRTDLSALPQTTSSSTSSGTAIGVSLTHSPDTLPDFLAGTPEGVSRPAREDGLLGSPLPVESQHIGYTQHGTPALSTAPATAAARFSPPQCTTTTAEAPPSASAPPVFQISNSVKYLKPQLMEAIAELGGVVDLGSGYSRSCRFLIAAEGITERTEKYLGACAAAAHIVPPRYVFDSQRRGYWLTNRVHDYDMSPQRCPPHLPRPPPIFRNWRVVLITCRGAAARGVRAALLAGGCTRATAFVVDLTADVPFSTSGQTHVVGESSAVDGVVEGVSPTSVIEPAALNTATHILVECSSVTAHGCFQLPDWVPLCVRQPHYTSRIYTLELLYFCLCAHPERIFDGEGLLCDGDALTPACRVESL